MNHSIQDTIRPKPLFYGAILFGLGIFAANFLSKEILLVGISAFLLSLFFIPKNNQKILLVLLGLVFFGALRLWVANYLPSNHIFYQVTEEQDSIFLTGSIASEVVEKETLYHQIQNSFILNSQTIQVNDGQIKEVSGKVKVSLKNPKEPLKTGDQIRLRGQLSKPVATRNPGGFNYQKYLDCRGVKVLFFGDKSDELKILKTSPKYSLPVMISRVRNFLARSIKDQFNTQESYFLKALFLGERQAEDGGLKDLFMKTGTMHLLAVSGFNIGFLSACILLFLRRLPISRNFECLIILVVLWSYCLLVGWQAPVVRASIMASVFIVGKMIGHKTNLLNILGFAALIILLINPKELFDLGFELSFLAVWAIGAILPIFHQKPVLFPNEKLKAKEKLAFYFSELFWVSFVCVLATLPLTIQNFYIVSPFSIAANLLVIPLSFFIFLFGFLFFMTFWWMPKFLALIPLLTKALIQVFIGCLWAIEHLPGSCVVVGKLNIVLLCILILGVGWILFSKRITHHRFRAALVVVFIVNVLACQEVARHFRFGKLTLTMLDVGQGDSIYFEFPNGGNMLIDAGKGGDWDQGQMNIAPFLKSRGVRSIDVFVMSHPQADHIGGAYSLMEEFKIRNVLGAGSKYPTQLFSNLKQKMREQKVNELSIKSAEKLEGFKGVEIDALNPPHDFSDPRNINNESLVLKIKYGQSSFLLTGDIQAHAFENILASNADIQSTVLKVPHHGGKLGASGIKFTQKVNPSFSLISAGFRNQFHHPNPETLNVLEAIPNNQIYRTDRDHAVTLVSDGSSVQVSIL